jgi:hypothetical protein
MTDINKLRSKIVKELFRTAPFYLLYFLIAATALVYTFGHIEYGPNLAYLASLLVIGIPFLHYFYQMMKKADAYRSQFTEVGGDATKASRLIVTLALLIPLLLLKAALIFFKVAERYIK